MSGVEQRLRQAILPISATLVEAIRNLDQVAIKIVLVTNNAGGLEGTVFDGLQAASGQRGGRAY